MVILVLGHGKLYEEWNRIRNSPIPPSEWLNVEHISVDMDPDMKPDIVHNLDKYPWPFPDASFDKIIDTTGIALKHRYNNSTFIKEVRRLLAVEGVFIGQNGFTITQHKNIKT
jgi:hypothetical protein